MTDNVYWHLLCARHWPRTYYLVSVCNSFIWQTFVKHQQCSRHWGYSSEQRGEKNQPYILSPWYSNRRRGRQQKYIKANICQGILNAKRKLNRVRGVRRRDGAHCLRCSGPRGSFHCGGHLSRGEERPARARALRLSLWKELQGGHGPAADYAWGTLAREQEAKGLTQGPAGADGVFGFYLEWGGSCGRA